MPDDPISPDPVTASASASIFGYLYQFEFALYRLLLNGPNIVVGIETEDDITESGSEGSKKTYVQSKVSLASSGHPLGNRTKNLWHTLLIWLKVLDEWDGGAPNFLFLTNRPVPADALVRRLANAFEDADVQAAVALLRMQGANVSKAAESAAIEVLKATDAQLSKLVSGVVLIDSGKPDGVTDLREATIALFQLNSEQLDLAEPIFESLLGLLIETCCKAWKEKKPALISKEVLVRRLQAMVAEHAQRRYVERPEHELSLQEYLNKRDLLFLRQIERMGGSQQSWDRALRDYWGFYTERIRLRESGDILPNDWTTRNSDLHRRWENICERHAELQIGRDLAIFRSTVNDEYHGLLGRGRSTQAYFTAGNYHALANGEESSYPLHWCVLDGDEA